MSSSCRVQAARQFVASVTQLSRLLHGTRPPPAFAAEVSARNFSADASRRLQLSRGQCSDSTRSCKGDRLRPDGASANPFLTTIVNPSNLHSNLDSNSWSSQQHEYSGHWNSRRSQDPHTRHRHAAVAVGAAAVAALGLCYSQGTGDAREGLAVFPRLHAKAPKKNPDELQMSGLKLNHRERRFIKFASVEFHGQLYMTPQDFIESVTDSEPRQRLRRRQLSQNDLDKFYQHTPPLRKGTSRMFREIYDKGIMSYTEYLFLLSILTKPQTGFHIAFNMFDTDGNERVDKQEFLVLMELLNGAVHKSLVTWLHEYSKGGADPAEVLQARSATQPVIESLYSQHAEPLESIFSTARRERLQRSDAPGAAADGASSSEALDDSLQKKHQVDTTLLVHFFGQKGKQDLKFEDFKMFMENLQTEVLEIEFNEFSKGLPTISELDFAKILLRYTHLQADQYEMYLERLIDKLSEEKGITFPEFKSFCQFLNTLEDFGIAMRMYTLAEQPISQEEFHRAVRICTGHSLSPHIVETVYNIFDDDGDGQLSYKEFIAIMKDRLHRGFKRDEVKTSGLIAFRNCLLRAVRS